MCWNDFLHKNILMLLEPIHVYSLGAKSLAEKMADTRLKFALLKRHRT